MASLLRKALRRLRKGGRTSGADSAAKAAKAKARAERAELKAAATTAVASGAWDQAATTYRRLLDRNGGKVSTRYALAKVLQRKYLVPFAMDAEAAVSTRSGEREAAFGQAVRELQTVVAAEPHRVRKTYFLGRHFEYAGRYAEAAEIYRRALAGLDAADEAWAHSCRLAWEFRLAWVQRRVDGGTQGGAAETRPPLAASAELAEPNPSGTAPAEPAAASRTEATEPSELTEARLARSAEPVGSEAGPTGGFFDATVTDRGLSISGFVRGGGPDTVELRLDGRFLVRVGLDPRQALRVFSITLTHRVLDEFAAAGRLTAHHGEAGLAVRAGGEAIDVAVPDGTGKLPVLLDSGHKVNKKGRLSPPGAESVALGPEYFAAYRRAREVFAEKLDMPLFLVYGTLLGCYRDGRPIPGDDDFDVAYLSFATEPQAVKDEAADVMAELLRVGFDVRIAIDGRPFHLGVAGVGIDVNPLWQHQGRVYGYTGHSLPRTALESVTGLELDGGSVDVPAGAEAFLADAYGPGWREPAPGFRYYRDEADLKLLRRARWTPAEVARFAERAEALRATDPNAGSFGGYAAPDNPEFD